MTSRVVNRLSDFALLRYRFWDIDLILNCMLVYSMLTVSIIANYVLVVVGLGTLLQAQGNLGITLLATSLVAVLFQPLCMRLQQAVKRLMYGDRDEPYHVISRLGSRLQDSRDPIYRVRPIYRARQGDEWTIAASYGSSCNEP